MGDIPHRGIWEIFLIGECKRYSSLGNVGDIPYRGNVGDIPDYGRYSS